MLFFEIDDIFSYNLQPITASTLLPPRAADCLLLLQLPIWLVMRLRTTTTGGGALHVVVCRMDTAKTSKQMM